jgi:hypothetical protein
MCVPVGLASSMFEIIPRPLPDRKEIQLSVVANTGRCEIYVFFFTGSTFLSLNSVKNSEVNKNSKQ